LDTQLARTDLLVDEWMLVGLMERGRRHFFEVIDGPREIRSTILAGPSPVSLLHDGIGNPTLANTIYDRLVHNALIITLKGPPLRKTRVQLSTS
jgi:hypothetical protein